MELGRLRRPDEIIGALQDEIRDAVEPFAHMEKAWSTQEMVKRISKYIMKAVAIPDINALPWQEVTKSFIASAMASYAASCQDKAWFFETDLSSAFLLVSWECLVGHGHKPKGQKYEELRRLVQQESEEHLEEALLSKAMWNATQKSFTESTVRSKVFRTLQKTYKPCLLETMEDPRPLEDLKRVETFTRKWLEDSISRVWSAVEGSDELNESNVMRLMRNLVAPFGDSHPFSCIPPCLTRSIGRPPRHWHYIPWLVENLFRSLRLSLGREGGATKRRKTVKTPEEEDTMPGLENPLLNPCDREQEVEAAGTLLKPATGMKSEPMAEDSVSGTTAPQSQSGDSTPRQWQSLESAVW